MTSDTRRPPGRPPGRQGADLLAVAREVLLERGFEGTTMQEVATRAGVSKSSLYREHPSKDALYVAVVADWSRRGRDSMRPHVDALLAGSTPREGLMTLTRVVLDAVLDPSVARVRQLVAAEADRFPDVAEQYLRDSWDSNMGVLADALGELRDRGVLTLTDPGTAAQQLVWMAVGAPVNAVTLTGGRRVVTAEEREAWVTAAVDTFLARFGAVA